VKKCVRNVLVTKENYSVLCVQEWTQSASWPDVTNKLGSAKFIVFV